ncbi:MAG: cobalamin-binding protein [Candidatus Edwardsbacteria bacterium]|jgi:iron complex transport system substrate-binding protein|nr:cobalamin-binding protein [Candidatus Edwardsbacteria bacterium]
MKRSLVLIIIAACLAGGCAKKHLSPALTLVDDAGRRVALPALPRRVVSLGPSITETVYALGQQDRLVGVTSWCNYPPEASRKTVVGDAASFNPERLLALDPDLVILAGTAQSPALVRLEALGIPALVLDPRTPDDIIADIELVGRALGAGPRADSLAAAMRTSLGRLRDSAELVPVGLRPTVFAEIGATPLFAAGPRSFLGQMIALAGGRVVPEDLPQDYAAVNPERVIGQDPDVILVLHPMAARGDVIARIGWSRIAAVRTGRVHDGIDLDIVLRPGPRFLRGVGQLRMIIDGRRP